MAAAAVVITACGAVKLGYQTLPEVSYWWLDNYLDFTDEQKGQVKEELASLQRWHRRNELPQFAELLDQMSLMAVKDVTPEQMCGVLDAVRTRLHAVGTQAEPSAATLALALKPEQLQALRKRYDKNNADYRKEWITPSVEKRDDKRMRKIVDYADNLYGKVDAPQREVIRRYVSSGGFDPVYDNGIRLRQQQDVLRTLEKLQATPDTSPADARKAISGLIDRSFDSSDPAVRAHQQAVRRAGCEAMAETHNTTDDKQRAHAVKQLQKYRQDAMELAAKQ
ncbi:DUF6279 family lipoprotein [Xylophilus sp. GOD-11R]|uniref:DUF6279 family lipoprotein n=1 Tax=Xylophilus sp. GOD-11R TaxID=3089814 RepID=UPI00298CF142|nr:DUF6279 family lipoprotein [Xylophilus sp. GOD-11R]WPB56327.1 DUF6279 family lipoprotein [Xylophilus sp. GOD-11R]